MIFDHVDAEQLASIMKISDIDDYPQIEGKLAPAAEALIAASVGKAWVKANESHPVVVLLFCSLLAGWLDNPEMFGEITPGCNSMITLLQAEALEV